MAIKIGGDDVIDNNKRGSFVTTTLGTYTQDQLRDLEIVGDRDGAMVYCSDISDFAFWIEDRGEWSTTSLLVVAEGGTLSTPGNGFTYHTFTSPGTFTVGVGGNVDVLLVAGGGGAAPGYASGGGGGGVVHHAQFEVTSQTYTVVVGQGGSNRAPGGDTTFGGMIAVGGGGGGQYSSLPASPGGSGGGQEGTETGKGTGIQPQQNAIFQPNAFFSQYGNPGGTGTTSGAYSAAGGGGAGGTAPPAGPGPGAGGKGGDGEPIAGFEYGIVGLSPLIPQANSSTENHYGAGGGGWGYSTQNAGLRPTGGGGRGGNGAPAESQNGLNGLGGGAGNNYYVSSSNKGGDGVVIIRYQSE